MSITNSISPIKEAFANLASAKMRSLLATLGILVGTAAVVTLLSCGKLASQKALQEFKTLGTDLLSVSMVAEKPSAQASTQNLSSFLNLARASPDIMTIAPYTSIYTPILLQGQGWEGTIIGATDQLANVIKIKIKIGRFLSPFDQYSYFCVIGNNLYQQIRSQGIENPLGQQIQLGNNFFTIIGVADTWPESGFFNDNINTAIIIPIQTIGLLSKSASISHMVLRLKDQVDIDRVKSDITEYVKNYLGEQKLFFRSAKELISRMENQQRIFTLLLGLIGSISLLVGGVGVMNIMLVSVIERRREIGIRMAVGAKRKDIRSLFLLEAMTLSFLGGILGVLLGIIISYLVASFAHWEFVLFLMPPTIGFIVSVAVGVFFGYYPAVQASKLDPIQTLRSE